MFGQVKAVVRELIDIGLVLIALAIVLSILVGGTVPLPFFGSVVDNLTGLVGKLGQNGLTGLIVLGVILWLFSNRGGTPSRK